MKRIIGIINRWRWEYRNHWDHTFFGWLNPEYHKVLWYNIRYSSNYFGDNWRGWVNKKLKKRSTLT